MELPDTYSLEEKTELKKRFDDIINLWHTRKNSQDVEMVTKAFYLAADAHKDARRRSGEPYMYHPLAVAKIIAGDMSMGRTSIICALLHDVVEDTNYTLDDIRELFGDKVAEIIDGVTKLEMKDFNSDVESIQAENFRKIVISMSDEIRVILVKIADRLHNMRTLDSMPHYKQLKIASETISIYAPLAYRLGLYAIKSELEDLSLKYINLQVFESVSKQISARREDKIKELQEFVEPVEKDLRDMGVSLRVKILERPVSAVWERMQKYGQSLDDVYDVFVVRLILDCPKELEKIKCWEAYAVFTMHYRPNSSKLRDWVSFPKTNGYESIHGVFMNHQGNWVEVQLRTERMEDIAEHGFSAYWKYNNTGNFNDESGFELWLGKVREMVASGSDSAIEFFNNFKLDLFKDEISVFTPQGDIITMPKDSTVLDFAYTIHSELGNHCIGANVNKNLVSLEYVLKMGDQVEVITSAYQYPREEWFGFLVTSVAKSRLKAGIKDYRKSFKETGKKIMSDIFAKLKIEFSKHNRNLMVERKHLPGRIDLYYYFAIKKFTQRDVEDVFCVKDGILTGITKYFTFKWSPKNENQEQLPKEILENNVDYIISTCCNPIPGDDVVAIRFPNEPLRVHRSDCPVAIELMAKHGKNILKAKMKLEENYRFIATLRIIGVDKMGLCTKILQIITDKKKLNMHSFEMHSEGGLAKATVSLFVDNVKSLDDLVKDLKSIELVKKVERVK